MAIYLVKGTKNGSWTRFSDEETESLRALMLKRDFRQVCNGDYRGPGGEYVGVRPKADAIQLQGINPNLLAEIRQTTNTRFYTTDTLFLSGNRRLQHIEELQRSGQVAV